jgi:hypothetical protein
MLPGDAHPTTESHTMLSSTLCFGCCPMQVLAEPLGDCLEQLERRSTLAAWHDCSSLVLTHTFCAVVCAFAGAGGAVVDWLEGV